MNIDITKLLNPSAFLGGPAADYLIKVGENDGLGTFHIPTGKYVPHVLARSPAEILNELSPMLVSPEMMASMVSLQGASLAVGAAGLAVGVVNLGVSAWTAWKVAKMDKKIDALTETTERVEHKIDSMSQLLESSVEHLDGLIRENALMLGFLIEHQHQMGRAIGEQLALVRYELATGVRSIHEALTNAEAQREARDFEQRMRSIFRTYEFCTHQLRAGNQAPSADLRRIIDESNGVIAWLDTRINALPVGNLERLPHFVARATALRFETDARELLEDGPVAMSHEYSRMREMIREELEALTHHVPIVTLAVDRSAAVERYVYLHRALRQDATLITFDDGSKTTLLPTRYLSWDDGLAEIRELMAATDKQPGPEYLELRSLAEHEGWRRTMDLPRGVSEERVSVPQLAAALGLGTESRPSEHQLRKLLHIGPAAIEAAIRRVRLEATV